MRRKEEGDVEEEGWEMGHRFELGHIHPTNQSGQSSEAKRLYYREPFSIFFVLAEHDWRFGVVEGDGNSFSPIFLQKAGL